MQGKMVLTQVTHYFKEQLLQLTDKVSLHCAILILTSLSKFKTLTKIIVIENLRFTIINKYQYFNP
jgi:hypothetical protein